MSEGKEQTAESKLNHLMFGEDCMKIVKIVEEVLETHDGLADSYRDLSKRERFTTARKISKSVHLYPLPEELLRERIKRHLEIDYAQFTSPLHFTDSFAECIETYRSGLFIACTMMTHSINEGILKFVVKQNNIKRECKESLLTTIDKLNGKIKLLTDEAAEASKAIYGSYRDAIHHMREDITEIPDWHEQAKKNLRNLAIVESCVFGFAEVDGGMLLDFPQHWDNVSENQIQVWYRFD